MPKEWNKTVVKTRNTSWLKKWSPRFSADNQPTSQQKKEWRERRKHAQWLLDQMIKYQDLTTAEFQQLVEKMDTLPIKDKINLKRLENILNDRSFLLDWINKHVPQAPSQQEITWIDWGPLQFANPNDSDIDKAIDENTHQGNNPINQPKKTWPKV